MSVKWTRNQCESGILRKNAKSEKKEELFVFGYSCKLFCDDEKALHVDQGKHLIPWMGDDTLKIDRYDARGALHDLSALEAPPGGFDWRVELTRAELDVEQLCDEERYRALHNDEDEEEMYKEEELKRLHAAGYGQVGFNYETPAAPEPESSAMESDEPFVASPYLAGLLPPDTALPETEKLNAIIDKTAKFIAGQGAQMEILLRAKQKNNPQFHFLDKESPLHAYYMALIGLCKAGKWPEKTPELPPEENHPEHNEEYLHPSLGSTIIESAPSIPSIHYRPSADCDYTMLISKIRGEATLDEPYEPSLAPGEVPPPGTRPLPLPGPDRASHIARPPVMYSQDPAEEQATRAYYQQYAAYYQQYMAQVQQPHLATPPPPQDSQRDDAKPAAKPPAVPGKSTGLSLMKNYNTDSDSDASDSDTSSTDSKPRAAPASTPPAPIPTPAPARTPPTAPEDARAPPTPPEDVRAVIEKMAAYVARNGDEFADIVRAKNDPRFLFLEPSNEYHGFYLRLMRERRGETNGQAKETKETKKKGGIAPVSFSIKKLKEPEPVLPKPALPYESSSDEEESDKKDSETKQESPKSEPVTPPITNFAPKLPQFNVPPPVVNKLEQKTKTCPPVMEKPPQLQKPKVDIAPSSSARIERRDERGSSVPILDGVRKDRVSPKRDRDRPKEEGWKEKKYRDKKEYRAMSENREARRERSAEQESRKRQKELESRRRRKPSRDELESEIISLGENSDDDMIDLTGDLSDTKDGDSEAEKAKQQERRRRAAEFLKKVGVDPAAAVALPTSSLASAMVDTLESLRQKKIDEEEKKRKREKKKHKHVHNGEREHKRKRRKHDDGDQSEHESSKKKKRKKDRKHSKSKRKRKRDESIPDQPLNIDLQSTLKELRTSSPTKDLGLEPLEDAQPSDASKSESSASEDRDEIPAAKEKKKKKERSEGEWSSDSEEDSPSSAESV